MIVEAPAWRPDAEVSSRRAQRPADWPGPGAIDLAVHDLPHASSSLEWWYVNAHLETETGRTLSLFASFFRSVVGRDQATGEPILAHALTWALVDVDRQRYLSESLVDRDAPAIALQQLDAGLGIDDPLIRHAMRDVVSRGQVPSPDTTFASSCIVGRDRLFLDFDGRRFQKLGGGAYRLAIHNTERTVACELTLSLQKPVVRHGADGVATGKSSEEMFYYFSPRCAVDGAVAIDGRRERIVDGRAWYDHEFGQLTDELGIHAVSWDWIGAQLDNGWDLTIYCMQDDATQQPCGRFAILIDPAGRPHRYDAFRFTGCDEWTSSKTFVSYPTTWQIEIPEAQLCLAVGAEFPAQELITVISRPSFWEGRVNLSGSFGDRQVAGRGFVERSGFQRTDSLTSFLGAVGNATRRAVDATLPLNLDAASATPIVGAPHRGDRLEGIDLDHLARSLVEPIRTIVDRAGKAWRSYLALACCDAVGGDSQPLLDWLAMPELMHVGSLMVDDVQDRSSVRRGGPAAHTIYGEPLTINAGTLCYFLPQIVLARSDLPAAHKLRIYELYFEATRAAHAGQALDLAGFAYAMPDIVERGDGAAAEARVRAIHRLKSAAPAGCLARIGAVVGNGSEAQIDGLGTFVERVGLAFQIVDDALNLSGFEGDLKSRGEDLAEGKVTMPVAKAMGLLDDSHRRWLWGVLAARPSDPTIVGEAIDLIDRCGALRACHREAEQLIEDGWAQLDPLLRESQAKLMLRAFSWFVLARHY